MCKGDVPEATERVSDSARILELSADRQALLVQRAGCRIFALQKRYVTEVVQQNGDPHPVCPLPSDGEALLVQGLGRGIFTPVASDVSQVVQRLLRQPRILQVARDRQGF